MATDAEFRDAAVAELKLTTAGWRKSNGQPNYPSGTAPMTTHWGKAMALLEQIGQSEPLPSPALPFAEALLSNPLKPAISKTVKTYALDTGKDYLIDLGMEPRPTLVLTGSPRRVHVINAHFQINDPMSVGPYWRGGLGLQLQSEHVSITDYFVEGVGTLADGFRIATGKSTKVTLQRARIEALADTAEPGEHCDALQVQGPVGRIEIGLATLQAAGVRAPNHGGKCLQVAHEPWPSGIYGGPFSVSYKHVNLVGRGSGEGKFGTMFIRGPEAHHVSGRYVGPITVDIEDMWARADGNGHADFPGWFAIYAATPGIVTGSKPSRRITFDPVAHKITGYVSEGGQDFVTRAALGV